MLIKICTLMVAFALAVNAKVAISLWESNVDVDYSEAAVNALIKAYDLSPDPDEEAVRLQSFSQYFSEAYVSSGGWNVVSNCSTAYLPNDHLFVTLKVVEGVIKNQISLLESNVDVSCDVAAVNALTESYNLYPTADEELKRLESFSQLYNEAYELSGGWNVASGCSLVYLSNSPKSVILKVIKDGATEDQAKIIRIFSNVSS